MFRDSAMWTSQMQPPRGSLAQTGASKPTFPSPMTEESIEKTAQRVQSSLRDLGIIARELLKGSRSEEVLSTAARSMVQHEGHIDNCALNIARLEILSQQIALHEECMEQSLSNVEDLQWKLNSLTNRTSKPVPVVDHPVVSVPETVDTSFRLDTENSIPASRPE